MPLVIRIYETSKPRDIFFFNSSKAIKDILTILVFSVSECNKWKINVSKCIKMRKEEFLSRTYSVSKWIIQNYYDFKSVLGF